MQVGLFEDSGWQRLLPVVRLRPIWDLWWGMDRLADKWARYFGWRVAGYWTERAYLHAAFPPTVPEGDTLWLNARLLPLSEDLRRWLSDLSLDKVYTTPEGIPVALRTRRPPAEGIFSEFRLPTELVPEGISLLWLEQVTDLFEKTGQIIYADWQYLRESSASFPPSLSVRGRENIFLHPTAKVGFAIIAAEDGPVWIGPHAEVQDGAIIQHTNTIGPHTSILLGARIRTHNSFGPYCKVGGEVGQSTFLGYSNKAHDGFFGHSVVGQWCNIGAGSNTSNLKNTYGKVRLYDPSVGGLRETGLQFCGLIMGDYARCGIQTPFTTGCMVDIFANVVSTAFTPKYIPPFWWGEGQYWSLEKAIETAQRMQQRRGRHLSHAEEAILRAQYAALVPQHSI